VVLVLSTVNSDDEVDVIVLLEALVEVLVPVLVVVLLVRLVVVEWLVKEGVFVGVVTEMLDDCGLSVMGNRVLLA